MALAFEAVGVPMAEILVVGDAIKDMKMAKSAGALGASGCRLAQLTKPSSSPTPMQ